MILYVCNALTISTILMRNGEAASRDSLSVFSLAMFVYRLTDEMTMIEVISRRTVLHAPSVAGTRTRCVNWGTNETRWPRPLIVYYRRCTRPNCLRGDGPCAQPTTHALHHSSCRRRAAIRLSPVIISGRGLHSLSIYSIIFFFSLRFLLSLFHSVLGLNTN